MMVVSLGMAFCLPKLMASVEEERAESAEEEVERPTVEVPTFDAPRLT